MSEHYRYEFQFDENGRCIVRDALPLLPPATEDHFAFAAYGREDVVVLTASELISVIFGETMLAAMKAATRHFAIWQSGKQYTAMGRPIAQAFAALDKMDPGELINLTLNEMA